MKKILTALVALMTLSVSANAMSYEQARREALFLTDKMAYELNLSDAQYDAAYEINLDYLMGVTSVDVWHILDKAQSRHQLYTARLAMERLLRCKLLLSTSLLECRLLALRHLRPLPSSLILLFPQAYCICIISRRTQLES